MFRLLRGRPGGGDQARGHAAGSRAAPATAAAGSGVAAASAVAGVGGAGLAHVAGVACVVDVAIGVSYIHARHGVEVPVAAAAAGVGYEHGLAGPRRRVRVRLGEEHGGEGQTHALLTRGAAAPFGRNLRAVRGLQVGALLYQHAVRHHVGLYLVRRVQHRNCKGEKEMLAEKMTLTSTCTPT